LVYIGQSINPKPSDQTDMKERHRCNLGGGGEPTYEGGTARWDQGVGWPIGGAGHPHMLVSWPLLRCGVFPSPLKSSGVVFAANKYDLI
jgi:hypothetical protein